mmetsp:Transcript_434/g.790  ORF Transcript_434/g.790 Transcript_434/m.790 type:complete len:475 (-) Transcript_434:12-1436(-)
MPKKGSASVKTHHESELLQSDHTNDDQLNSKAGNAFSGDHQVSNEVQGPLEFNAVTPSTGVEAKNDGSDWKPKVGDRFNTFEDLCNSIQWYALKSGFRVSRGNSHSFSKKRAMELFQQENVVCRGRFYCKGRKQCSFQIDFCFANSAYQIKIAELNHLGHEVNPNTLNITEGKSLVEYEGDLNTEELEKLKQLAEYSYAMKEIREKMNMDFPNRIYSTPVIRRLIYKFRAQRFGRLESKLNVSRNSESKSNVVLQQRDKVVPGMCSKGCGRVHKSTVHQVEISSHNQLVCNCRFYSATSQNCAHIDAVLKMKAHEDGSRWNVIDGCPNESEIVVLEDEEVATSRKNVMDKIVFVEEAEARERSLLDVLQGIVDNVQQNPSLYKHTMAVLIEEEEYINRCLEMTVEPEQSEEKCGEDIGIGAQDTAVQDGKKLTRKRQGARHVSASDGRASASTSKRNKKMENNSTIDHAKLSDK